MLTKVYQSETKSPRNPTGAGRLLSPRNDQYGNLKCSNWLASFIFMRLATGSYLSFKQVRESASKEMGALGAGEI